MLTCLQYGGSGAGKSASYVIPNALQLLGSYVFTDPKGELYDKTAGFFKEKGYNVKVFNLVNPENSDGYNATEGRKAPSTDPYQPFPMAYGDMWIHEF